MSMIGRFKDYIGSIIKPVVEAIKPKWVVADHDDTIVASAFTAALTQRVANELGAFGMKFVTDAVNEAESTGMAGPQKFTYAVAASETAFKANGINNVGGSTLAAAVQSAVMELQAAKKIT